MTKIDIISGFLGAGKTTLIKKLLQESLIDENVVLIENEFGEIGIDGGFLKEAGVEIKEMNSGCICCSLVGDFEASLKKVMQDHKPQRIIIEPSGVGKLSDVLQAVENVKDDCDLHINSLTTVADAQKCHMYMKNFGEFYNDQIETCHTIVLSRTQNISEDKLMHVIHELRHHNASATIITTPWNAMHGNIILEAMEHPEDLEQTLLEEVKECPTCGHHHEHDHHSHVHHEHHKHCDCEHDHNHHHADDIFTSWGCETTKRYTDKEIETMLSKLSDEAAFGTILRAKGMLESNDPEWLYFDFVPEDYNIRKGAPTYTGRFCIIGADLNVAALQELFQVQ